MIKVYSKSLFFNHSLTGRALLIIILLFSCFPESTYAQKPFKIVIDAGHGGKDPGRPNKSGIKENTLNEIYFTDSLDKAIDRDIDIFIEATGNPIVGTVHAEKIIKKGIIGATRSKAVATKGI